MTCSRRAHAALLIAAILVAAASLVCTPFEAGSESGDASAPSAVSDATPDTSTGAPGRYAARILADAPIGYWRLDETSGIVAHDSSGHGHDGTYGASVVLGQSSLVGEGYAAKFDGSTDPGATHFVQIPASSGLEPATWITIECWVRMPLSVSTESLVFYGSTDHAPYESYDLWGHGAYVVANDGGVYAEAPSPLSTGATHYVAAVDDGASLRFYVDGITVASMPALGAIGHYDGVHGLGIGSAFDAKRATFDGVIDEVAVYDVPLNPQQIFDHYEAGLAR